MAITIHAISPVAVDLFGLEIRWYALAYIAAFVIGYRLVRLLARSQCSNRGKKEFEHSKKYWDDLLTAVILGVLIGGRLGYVLFYNLPFFIAHPWEIFMIWHGGMAFHGGLAGVIVSVFIFAFRMQNNSAFKIPHSTPQNAFGILDIVAVITPIGLFLGRIANFINIEVMGRPTNGSLGVVFVDPTGMPIGDGMPRHASPLYEAAMEGILLLVIMCVLWRCTRLRERAGALSGVFAMLYAVFRAFVEQFREPDAQIGFLTGWGLTMGQLLSIIMFIAGSAVLAWSYRNNKTLGFKR